MRILEVRRHTMRRKPGQHLSSDGIKLANYVGSISESFCWVVTSTIPRASETSVAMGFEVNETAESLGLLPDDVFANYGWPIPFTEGHKLLDVHQNCYDFAHNQSKIWESIVKKIPDSKRALIITHGIFVELGAIASMPLSTYKDWGNAIGYCEGVRLGYDDGFVQCEMLRLPTEYQKIEN